MTKIIRRLDDIKTQNVQEGELIVVAKSKELHPVTWASRFMKVSEPIKLDCGDRTVEFGGFSINTISRAGRDRIHMLCYSTTEGEVNGSYCSFAIDYLDKRFKKSDEILKRYKE